MSKDKASQESINISGKGDIVMQGSNVSGSNNSANYSSVKFEQSTDTQILTKELSELLKALQSKATDPEHFIAMGNVASAQKSAEEGNMSKVHDYLSKTGKWVLDIAQKAGAQVVAEIIKSSAGLG